MDKNQKEFTRHLSDMNIKNVKKLLNENHDLKVCIENGVVFFAIRSKDDSCVDLYFEGSRLARVKPKTIIWHNNSSNYDMAKKMISSYPYDKERAELALLYKKYSPFNKENKIILLDIEVGFPRIIKDSKVVNNNIQIDLLFLDRKKQKCVFVEAKKAGDSRINKRNATYSKLEISEQMDKYKRNLLIHEDNIKKAYNNYINIINTVFGCNVVEIPDKISLDLEPKLLIYGKLSDDGVICKNLIEKALKKDNLIVSDSIDEFNAEEIF